MKSENLERSERKKNLKKLEKVLDKFDKMCYYIKVRGGHKVHKRTRLYLVN